MKILVEGTRGKSGIVQMLVDIIESRGKPVMGKITGLETCIFHKGQKIYIKRKNRKFLIDKENKKVLRDYKDVEYKVFENQALSPYTMKAVHTVFKPDIVTVPNIRYEHQDTLGETIQEQAKSFAINFEGAKVVVTTEPKEEVLKVFRKYCKRYKARLIEIKRDELFPGLQAAYIVDETIKYLFGEGLSEEEFKKIIGALASKISVKYNEELGISYFRGSKVNDIESTRNVYNFLKGRIEKPFCFVCYFRKDRPERTKAFIPLFKEILKDNQLKKMFVLGHHLGNLPKDSKIVKLNEKESNLILRYCKKNDCVLFTAVNGVTPFMQELELNLEGGKK